MQHFEIFTNDASNMFYNDGSCYGMAFCDFIEQYKPVMRVQADTIDALLDNVPEPSFRYRSVDKSDIQPGDVVAGDHKWYLRTKDGFRVIWGTI